MRYAFFLRVSIKISDTQQKILAGSVAQRDLIPSKG